MTEEDSADGDSEPGEHTQTTPDDKDDAAPNLPGPESDLDDVDPEDIDWDQYDEYFQDRSVDDAGEGTALGTPDEELAGTEEVEEAETEDEHIVPTRSYCQNCQYFSAPPEVKCNHEGTTIVEFVDLDHVRVRECPIVAERQSVVERRNRSVTLDAKDEK